MVRSQSSRNHVIHLRLLLVGGGRGKVGRGGGGGGGGGGGVYYWEVIKTSTVSGSNNDANTGAVKIDNGGSRLKPTS
ncbi:hypothetical protein LDENG_00255140 [Lucifuga dentata]|nr:hypothetical protein LDENG_00255140 [Lucifuga dentata]